MVVQRVGLRDDEDYAVNIIGELSGVNGLFCSLRDMTLGPIAS